MAKGNRLSAQVGVGMADDGKEELYHSLFTYTLVTSHSYFFLLATGFGRRLCG